MIHSKNGIVGFMSSDDMVLMTCYEKPLDEDFDEMLAFTLEKLPAKVVVVDRGFSISAIQRRNFGNLIKECEAKVAVLTNSALVRSAAVAVGFFYPRIRAFGLYNIEDACAFLGDAGIEPVIQSFLIETQAFDKAG